jgi:formate hydrogenlyase subunit 6/NADH:ubiquinone oxidoreductase subunit I
MKIGAMFRDVATAFFQKPVTQKYPFERQPAPARLRGKLVWNGQKCTGCSLCSKDCPSDAIQMVVNDKQTKTFVLQYHVDRCIFCAQCVQNCRLKCLEMSNQDWELASLSKEPFTLYYGDEAKVQAYLEQVAAAQAAADPVEECGE